MFKSIIGGLYLKEISLKGIEPEYTGVTATLSSGFLRCNSSLPPSGVLFRQNLSFSEISGHGIYSATHHVDSLCMCNKCKVTLETTGQIVPELRQQIPQM